MRDLSFNFGEYMLNVAKKHVDVKHSDKAIHYVEVESFASISVPGNATASAPFIMPVISLDESNFAHSTVQGFYTFIVLDKSKDKAKSIAMDIIAKMKYDQEMNANGMYGLDTSTITLSSIPKVGAYSAVMVSFVADAVNSTTYSPTKWGGE